MNNASWANFQKDSDRLHAKQKSFVPLKNQYAPFKALVNADPLQQPYDGSPFTTSSQSDSTSFPNYTSMIG